VDGARTPQRVGQRSLANEGRDALASEAHIVDEGGEAAGRQAAAAVQPPLLLYQKAGESLGVEGLRAARHGVLPASVSAPTCSKRRYVPVPSSCIYCPTSRPPREPRCRKVAGTNWCYWRTSTAFRSSKTTPTASCATKAIT